ncbi:MAG: hypothetical protein KXJ53_04985, partial [Phenylobacterium sp.]|nr:hypothetical protein [Phenylobacterium sp.]
MANEVAEHRPAERRGWRWLYLALASLTGALGVVMAGLGVWLITLGGSFYYLAAGALLAAGAVFAWRRRDRLALGLFAAAFLLTLAWSLIEIGGKGWLPAWGIDLAGRIGVLTGLLAAVALAYLLWRSPPRST